MYALPDGIVTRLEGCSPSRQGVCLQDGMFALQEELPRAIQICTSATAPPQMLNRG